MRRKLFVGWLVLLGVAICLFIVGPMNAFNNERNAISKDYYKGMELDSKYHKACGSCMEYLSDNEYGNVVSVSAEEVVYADVKSKIVGIEGSYEDDDILWQLTFVQEGAGKEEVALFCDPNDEKVSAIRKSDMYLEPTFVSDNGNLLGEDVAISDEDEYVTETSEVKDVLWVDQESLLVITRDELMFLVDRDSGESKRVAKRPVNISDAKMWGICVSADGKIYLKVQEDESVFAYYKIK